MDGSRKTVTIGIPTFNRPSTLEVALRSATSQTYGHLRIVVSDNASPTAETETLVRRVADADARVSYRRHPTNVGPYSNFVSLCSDCETRYFMWLADDDELDGPDYISTLVAAFDREPSAKLVFPSVDIFSGDDRATWHRGVMTGVFGSCLTDEDYLRAWCKYGGGYPFYGLYLTQFLREFAPDRIFSHSLPYYSEGVFLHHLFLRGGVRYCADARFLYNGHNSSSRLTSRTMLSAFLRYSLQVHGIYLLNRPDLLPLITKSHYPSVRILSGRAFRGQVGGG